MPVSPRGRAGSPFGRVPRVAQLGLAAHQQHRSVQGRSNSHGACVRCCSGGRHTGSPHAGRGPPTPHRVRTGSPSAGGFSGSRGGPALTNPKWVSPNASAVSHAPRTVGRNKTIDPEWALPSEAKTQAYPNWTLDDSRVHTLPPNRDPSPPNAGRASPRKPEKVELTSQMGAYPNWTLGGSKRQGSPGGSSARSGRRAHFGNEDIEGSKPALRKFGKAGQRIVADPYPDTLSCPVETGWNRGRTNTITPWRDVDGRLPGRAQSPGTKLYDQNQGTLRTKEVQVFKEGRYHTTEVLTHRRVEEFGLGVQRDGRPVTVESSSPRFVRSSSSLRTSDIDGAQPRPFNTPVRQRTSSSSVQSTSHAREQRLNVSVASQGPPAAATQPQQRQGQVQVQGSPRSQSILSGVPAPARQRPSFSHDLMMTSQISFF